MEILTPKKNVIMDATVLTALMNCSRYLDFRFNSNYIPISGKGNPLDAGILVHLILEKYNQALIAGNSRVNAICIGMAAGQKFYTENSTNIPIDNVKDDRGKLKEVGYNYIVSTMESYFERWKNNNWTPVEAERVRGLIVYEDDEIRVFYKAKIDLIADTYDLGLAVIDYKTMKQKRDALSLNNQFRGQCLVTKTRTVFIDKIGWQQTLEPEEKFVRQPISYSAEILAEQIELIGYYAKILIQLREQNYYPPNFTNCDKWNGCIFRHVCEANPSDRQRVLNEHFVIGETWDPGNEDDSD